MRAVTILTPLMGRSFNSLNHLVAIDSVSIPTHAPSIPQQKSGSDISPGSVLGLGNLGEKEERGEKGEGEINNGWMGSVVLLELSYMCVRVL